MNNVPFASPADVRAATARVLTHLRAGGLIAYPTETVYGLGGLMRADALGALAALKSRDAVKPFLLLIRDAADMPQLAWTPAAQKLADVFWPGPLTLALGARGDFPPRIVSESGTVAVRATPHAGVRALLQALKEPITSTSANLPHSTPAMNAQEVATVLDELGAPDVLVLDGGELAPSAASTVVDCSGERPRIVRRGAITVEALTQVVELAHD